MTITVPENYLSSIDVDNTNGVIDVNGISLQGDLTLETANGLISVDDVTATGDIDVRTTNSKIEVNNTTSSGDIAVRSMNGYITLDGIVAADIDAQTTNGKIAVENIAAQNMKLVTTNGQVTTSDVDINVKIHLETSNGDIRGNVKGPASDYDIDSQTTNGANNLAVTIAKSRQATKFYMPVAITVRLQSRLIKIALLQKRSHYLRSSFFIFRIST
jgi:DUF4097 and DUF4098 domain-containing protein YvlB